MNLPSPDTRSAPQAAPVLPTQITQLSPTEMRLGWSTGEAFALPFMDLRSECPCAVCVDEHTGVRRVTRDSLDPWVKPKGVSLIGRYALHVDWSDGHSTGMFHFDRLRELCLERGRRL